MSHTHQPSLSVLANALVIKEWPSGKSDLYLKGLREAPIPTGHLLGNRKAAGGGSDGEPEFWVLASGGGHCFGTGPLLVPAASLCVVGW